MDLLPGLGIKLCILSCKITILFPSQQDSVSDGNRESDLSFGSTDSSMNNRVCPKRKKPLKTTNAYFYWVTREQGSFDWFKGVMNEVADLDQRVKKNAPWHHFISFVENFPSFITSTCQFGN